MGLVGRVKDADVSSSSISFELGDFNSESSQHARALDDRLLIRRIKTLSTPHATTDQGLERDFHLVEARLRRRLSSRAWLLPVKRLIDLIVALVALVVLAPFLLMLIAAIKISSPGPAFFVQTRVGLSGRPFRIYKLRTFYANESDASGIRQTVSGDPRVTPLGRILRQRNIDELPQLLNVVKGDMSLVGPRPHPVDMVAAGRRYEDFALGYPLRYLARPGITGLAQVRGFRGPTINSRLARMRVVCDLAYIANFSLIFDFRILAATVVNELRGGTGE